MKTSQKIRCQPITARKWASKMGLVKVELQISEHSEFSILALYWNRKFGKLGNIFKTCQFHRVCFIWGSWKFPRFPSFRFSPLYWNQKLGKLENIFKTCNFQRTFLFEEVGNFRGFWFFDFGPYTEIENWEKWFRYVTFILA